MSSVYVSKFKPSITAIPLMNVKYGNEEKVLHTLKISELAQWRRF